MKKCRQAFRCFRELLVAGQSLAAHEEMVSGFDKEGRERPDWLSDGSKEARLATEAAAALSAAIDAL